MASRKLILFMLLAFALAAVVPGMGASAHEGGPHIRIAHLAPAAPAVDIYVNDQKAVEKLEYKTVTDYLPLEGMSFKVVVVPAGGDPAKDSVSKEPFMVMFTEAEMHGYYTVAAVGSPADGSFDLIRLPADGPHEAAAMGGAEVGTATVGNIKVTGAWARATSKGEAMDHSGMGGMATPEATPESMGGMGGHGGMGMGGVSAAYMVIANTGDKAERLVSAATDVAGVVEIHETKVENDIARMEPIAGGLEIPAGGSVELKPGGKHIMMMELKQALVAGSTITLTLNFESGTVVTLVVPVVAP